MLIHFFDMSQTVDVNEHSLHAIAYAELVKNHVRTTSIQALKRLNILGQICGKNLIELPIFFLMSKAFGLALIGTRAAAPKSVRFPHGDPLMFHFHFIVGNLPPFYSVSGRGRTH
ncbi:MULTISPECIES: hypothetical protein [Paenibacillus]|uniref:Uncharacterized protein n=2 Tax=Paenibacillus TaxID=44249 RepID=A0ABT8VFM1_9BACL|nr:hypothetical protein [Paenibacillus ehimensis]MDO3679788.1 hypothetical protein [Paenibacillus ehimensis]MEC0209883.1 hypothetical protein [Paenibacillus ehimensis]